MKKAVAWEQGLCMSLTTTPTCPVAGAVLEGAEVHFIFPAGKFSTRRSVFTSNQYLAREAVSKAIPHLGDIKSDCGSIIFSLKDLSLNSLQTQFSVFPFQQRCLPFPILCHLSLQIPGTEFPGSLCVYFSLRMGGGNVGSVMLKKSFLSPTLWHLIFSAIFELWCVTKVIYLIFICFNSYCVQVQI